MTICIGTYDKTRRPASVAYPRDDRRRSADCTFRGTHALVPVKLRLAPKPVRATAPGSSEECIHLLRNSWVARRLLPNATEPSLRSTSCRTFTG